MPPRLAVTVTLDALSRKGEAEELAHQLELPTAALGDIGYDHFLALTPDRLELRSTGLKGTGPLFVDFIRGPAAYRRRQRESTRQPLARAAGLKPTIRPDILDVTAGLGGDGFVLATLGCRVRLIERSPILGALLADGLKRAAEAPETAAIAARMELVVGDSLQLLPELVKQRSPETIYLDPMYPQGVKKSALVKIEMRLLREMVGNDPDAPLLLSTALACEAQRVVVKRSRLAPTIAGPEPHGVITGKNSRYDLYLSRGPGSGGR